MARRWWSVVASFALAAEIARASSARELEGKASPRDECRASFAACAPPARFEADTDVSKLTTRNLVHVAARLDVPDKLATAAAKHLLKIVMAAQQSELLEIEAALDDTAAVLGRCRCPDGFKSELEKRGIAELVRSRLPARELRSPELWADQMGAELAAIRELRRRTATTVAAGGADDEAGVDVREAQARELQRRLCVTVHGARTALPPAAFAIVLDLVYRKEVADAGDGSASAARRMIAEHEAAESCSPAEAR